ncbi:MAG: undecaprenyl-phosphate glucose phosphotransferase [Frankiales bacterium]|nr:undecaprenyl-phosphate glucose phosphotransferase [Frankiales bacterium]
MTEALDLPTPLVGLDTVDWSLTSERPHVPMARRRLRARPSRAVDVLSAVHGAHGAPVAVACDAAVVLLAATVVGAGSLAFRVLLAAGAVLAGYLCQVYTTRDTVQTRGFLWYPQRVVAPLAVTGGVAVAATDVPLGDVTAVLVVAVVLLTAARALTWSVLVVARRTGRGLRPTLIVGDGETAGTVWRRLVEFPEAGLLPTQLLTFEGAHVPGAVERELVAKGIRHVVLVSPGPEEALLTAALPRQATRAPFFSTVPPLAELFLDPRSVSEVGGIPLIPLGRVTRARRTFPGKRALDLAVAGLMALLLAPLGLALALAIRCDDGGPVFYRQSRVGRDGVSFPMLKFRTMVVGADRMLDVLEGDDNISDGLLFKLRDDPRITRVGRLLRKTSLDELPQLVNVLQGTMSLVGPRPLPVAVEDFAPMEAERHTVLPGITGYWQLSGGPELTYAEMIRLDLAYIRTWSLWQDLRLLLRTIPAVLHRHGAS